MIIHAARSTRARYPYRRQLIRMSIAAGTLAALLLGASRIPRVDAAQTAPRPAPAQSTTSGSDQTELSITVYNSDLALVRDVREITLPAGTFQLKFMDIAASVNPATVHFRSLNDPGRLSVLEQNYEYDLLEPQKLLAKYVGREVTLMRPREVNGTTQWEDVKATLISDNNGPVWKIGNEIVTGFNPAGIRFPELPENLYDRPTLLWTIDNRGPAKQKVEASYLATKLSWSADYVLTVNREETGADLGGWVTLVNNSGTSFQNARLQLVAGQLNRVRPEVAYKALGGISRLADAAAPPQFEQEAFNEYHLYTLGRPTSVANNESKQVSLLDASAIPVTKTYEVNGQSYYYRSAIHPGAPVKDPVQVYYKFQKRREVQPGHAAAGRDGAHLPGRFARQHAVRRRGPHYAHAQGRAGEPARGRRV